MNKPDLLISIVIPVYNQQNYIRGTVESILSQSWRSLECIVVDDGSTDSTLEILKTFGARIRIIAQANQGQAVAQNVGFREAKGDLIGYLGSDDLLDPEAVQFLLAEYEAQGGGDMVVFPDYRWIDEEGAIIKHSHNAYTSLSTMVHQFQCDIGPGALFSRGLLEAIGGWNTDYRQIPDFEFWLRAGKISRFAYVPRVLASWRVHPGSQTAFRSSSAKADEPVRLIMDVREAPDRYAVDDHRQFEVNGFVLAACLHMRAGRFGRAFAYLRQAFKVAPAYLFSISAVRRLATSYVGFIRSRHM